MRVFHKISLSALEAIGSVCTNPWKHLPAFEICTQINFVRTKPWAVMYRSNTGIVKSSLHQTFTGKKERLPVLPCLSKSYSTNIYLLFTAFKKVLLTASDVWLRGGTSESAALLYHLPLDCLTPCKEVHLLSWFICLILMAQISALHASVVFTSLFGLLVWQLIHWFDFLLCALFIHFPVGVWKGFPIMVDWLVRVDFLDSS